MAVIVLLSGGMDSAVCLYWAAESFNNRPVYGLSFDYGQVARRYELGCAKVVWAFAAAQHRNLAAYKVIPLANAGVFSSPSSILGGAPVDQYADVEAAVRGTSSDKSYVPLRNSIFVSIAAHQLLVFSPMGGHVVVGIRARADAPGGFPDCTSAFANSMSRALTQASGQEIGVSDPLNHLARTRVDTLRLAKKLPGCFQALAHTVSCFSGTRCGHCLPCLRRAAAFNELGEADPAQE